MVQGGLFQGGKDSGADGGERFDTAGQAYQGEAALLSDAEAQEIV